MSIRRKSTTHDLATLRLHPDGSRVQQSSLNSKRRTAASTVVDSRGNWIARDAGGKSVVKKRIPVNRSHISDVEGEFIDLSECNQSKGKQRACNDQGPDEDSPQELESGRLNPRARQRLSFKHDLSFLDPPPVSVSSLEQDVEYSGATSAGETFISFPDPAPDLLKAIHHFSSCYYLDRGQLSDSSKNFRGEKKQRHTRNQENIHILAANALKYRNGDSGSRDSEAENEIFEGNEDENEAVDVGESQRGESSTKPDAYRKDMYKAFDGSALMAIGIVLQEHVAHTLLSGPRTAEEPRTIIH